MTANPEKKPPPGEAEILPFRVPPKAAPAKRPAPPAAEDDVQPLSDGALIRIGIFLICIVVLGVWLMNTMRDMGKLEDCAMQGRRNCVPIAAPYR